MIRIRPKQILLVAPRSFANHFIDSDVPVKHVSDTQKIFPAIYESKPSLIILDHTLLGNNLEKIVRRLRTNAFYNKTKICCYKTRSDKKADDLLKAIGVDYLIHPEVFNDAAQSEAIKWFRQLFDVSSLNLVGNLSY